MMRAYIFFLCILLLACEPKTTDNHVAGNTPAVAEPVRTFDSGAVVAKTIARPIPVAPPAIAVGKQSVRLLFTGAFHGDEVEVGVDSLAWFALLPGDSGDFVLQNATIVAKRVVDGLLDDEASGEMTGWEITTATEDPIMLVWQTDLREGFVDGIAIPQEIFPGDSVRIEFLGVRYLLTATGSNTSHSYGTTVSDYRLHFSRTENGVTASQVLVSHAAFDDAMTTVRWSGDLDRDGYLDLLIDMSNHYNRTAPTLFLSKPAGPDEVVVAVAEHSSVGC